MELEELGAVLSSRQEGVGPLLLLSPPLRECHVFMYRLSPDCYLHMYRANCISVLGVLKIIVASFYFVLNVCEALCYQLSCGISLHLQNNSTR